MKIKIISEGTGRSTKIINAEMGEIIEGVYAARWECDAKSIAKAELTFVNVAIEVEGETE